MNPSELKVFVESNKQLVSARESKSHPGLYVLKYTKRVFYDDLWNDYLEWCRGTIVDQDYNLVQLPFQKIYNHGIESKAPTISDQETVVAYRKVNGFMVAVTWHDGDILISTAGMVDSAHIEMAKEMMQLHASWFTWKLEVAIAHNYTLIFECVHPSDPHIIPEAPGMYFIGARKKSWDSTVNGFSSTKEWQGFASTIGCNKVESFVLPFGELREMLKTVEHEGFVVYCEDGRVTKMKSPYYLTCKWVSRNVRTDKLMNDSIFSKIDEEYFPLIRAIRENIVDYTAMNEQERLEWVRAYLNSNSKK